LLRLISAVECELAERLQVMVQLLFLFGEGHRCS